MKFRYLVVSEDYEIRGTNNSQDVENLVDEFIVIDCETSSKLERDANPVLARAGGIELKEIQELKLETQTELEVELEDEDDGERTDLTGDDL